MARPPDRLTELLKDRYALERELGAGAMATVYLAHDLKHDRRVALKVLRRELAAVLGAERFLIEIKTTAALQHPHILPLFDSGRVTAPDATDAFLYYVMPYVEGESLRNRLQRETRLDVEEAVRIATAVASALDYAHRHGVIHRDVKPENILLHDGHPMVADFGIALAIQGATGGRLTETGLLVGTPLYMSPEQATGEVDLDARSDVYSLGCVLYEMLAGAPPHDGPTAHAMIARRLTEPAPSVRKVRSSVPAHVDRALLKALATDRGDRFASAGVFAQALGEREASGADVPVVAVLPFVNLSADPENEFFADGITEDVIAQLSKVRALKVISRTSVMQFKNREQSLREIGAHLEATTVLEGSVRRAADRVRIVAQLIDVHTDQHLWAETYDRRLTDIFLIQTDVALHIVAALRAELSRDERDRIGREPTADLEAYQLYLRGRQSYLRGTADGFRNSTEYFARAIDRDPRYAMAHVGLALAYTELGETGADRPEVAYKRAEDAALRALALDGELGEAHCVLAYVRFVSDFDWAGAEESFKRALELTPGNADTYELYGRLCAAVERYDEAIAMLRRAQELDPLMHRVDLATAYLRAGSYDEALRTVTRAIELDPLYPRAQATAAWVFVLQGGYEEGLSYMKHAVALAPGDPLWLAQLGQVYGMIGDGDRARDVLRQLEELSQHRYVSPYHLAYVHTGLGNRDRAIDYLEKAYAARSGAIYGVKGSFLFRSLHTHPRFTALLRKMNLA